MGSREEILRKLSSKTVAFASDEKTVLCWDLEKIGLTNLGDVLSEHGIRTVANNNPEIRYGITGVEVALSATGSFVLTSGAGNNRATSLLPLVHIAVIRTDQIVQDLERWLTRVQKERRLFQETSNIVIITGPSKTADIAMELVTGMHGPKEVQLILIEK